MDSTFSNESVSVRFAPTCRLCGASGSQLFHGLRDRLYGAPGIWNLLSCPECSLVWVDPSPDESQIAKLYPDSYYTHPQSDPESVPPLRTRLKDHVTRAVEDRLWWHSREGLAAVPGILLASIGAIRDAVEAELLWQNPTCKSRLLDVGCGSGEFLARMGSLGWEVRGVEPDPAAAEHATRVHGVSVIAGNLREAALSECSFDVITMSHVIEHVPDPRAELAECMRLLKPGGRLTIATPNPKSLARRIFGPGWFGWDPPRHLFLFTPMLLADCVDRAGMRIDKEFTSARTARMSWAVSRLLRGQGTESSAQPLTLSPRLRLEGLVFWVIEYLAAGPLQLGEEIVLTAIKPG